MNSQTQQIVDQAAALVRRSRAGDQNAMAQIFLIGQNARKGDKRAKYSAQAIQQYIQDNPPETTNIVRIGDEPPVIMDSPDISRRAMMHGEDGSNEIASKPTLPRGALSGVCDPDHYADVIVKASEFQNGIDAAAVVLAAGRMLTRDAIDDIVESDLGEKEAKIFLFGVMRCTPEDWEKTAPNLNDQGKKYLTLGQCFGRARRLQAIRQPSTRISKFAPVAGWELGE
jgi:hypothetical protein